MGTLRISAGDLHCTGQWVDGSPRTIEAVRRMLPLRSRLIHVRWSGEGCWVPLGGLRLDIPPENATSHPAPGELIIYPGGLSECEILLAYGAVDFSSKVGQLAGNHFASLDVNRDQLRELGRRCLWEGAQDVLIEEVDRAG
ncbi:MAG: DUF3830 family protein [Chloroflexi bacterium]|nr:DUF3830 family protein [Chloroflexota bacterium]